MSILAKLLVVLVIIFGLWAQWSYDPSLSKLKAYWDSAVRTVNQAPLPSPQPTSIPSSRPVQKSTTKANTSSQITCTGPDGKTFKTTQEECDSFNKAWGNAAPPDPNEIIQCNIHPNCGGGYKEIARSSCEQITCCSLKNGNILTSSGDCKNKQYNECTETGMSAGLSLYYAMEACKQYK